MAFQLSAAPLVRGDSGPASKSVVTTVNVLALLLLGLPLSVTTTVIELVIVPCGPEGSQAKAPLVGLMVAPEGAFAPRLKVRIWAGISLSVAVKLSESSLPFKTVRLEAELRSGGVLVASESGLAGSERKSR